MTCAVRKAIRCSKGLLSLSLLCSLTCTAANVSYSGHLLSDSFDRPIPIVVDFDDSGGKLMGIVQTSSPLTSAPVARGTRRMLGDKRGDECDIVDDLGNELKLSLIGTCTSILFQGQFLLYLRDQQIRDGTFSLKRVNRPKDEKKKMTEAEKHSLATSTNITCLRSNSACLGACARVGDSNTQFLCANNCRHKLVTCREKGRKKLDQSSIEKVE